MQAYGCTSTDNKLSLLFYFNVDILQIFFCFVSFLLKIYPPPPQKTRRNYPHIFLISKIYQWVYDYAERKHIKSKYVQVLFELQLAKSLYTKKKDVCPNVNPKRSMVKQLLQSHQFCLGNAVLRIILQSVYLRDKT